MKILNIKIHVAQHVGKDWISRKNLQALLQDNFPQAGQIQKTLILLPLLLSALGGAIGTLSCTDLQKPDRGVLSGKSFEKVAARNQHPTD